MLVYRACAYVLNGNYYLSRENYNDKFYNILKDPTRTKQFNVFVREKDNGSFCQEIVTGIKIPLVRHERKAEYHHFTYLYAIERLQFFLLVEDRVDLVREENLEVIAEYRKNRRNYRFFEQMLDYTELNSTRFGFNDLNKPSVIKEIQAEMENLRLEVPMTLPESCGIDAYIEKQIAQIEMYLSCEEESSPNHCLLHQYITAYDRDLIDSPDPLVIKERMMTSLQCLLDSLKGIETEDSHWAKECADEIAISEVSHPIVRVNRLIELIGIQEQKKQPLAGKTEAEIYLAHQLFEAFLAVDDPDLFQTGLEKLNTKYRLHLMRESLRELSRQSEDSCVDPALAALDEAKSAVENKELCPCLQKIMILVQNDREKEVKKI